jgi:hypothetical protein
MTFRTHVKCKLLSLHTDLKLWQAYNQTIPVAARSKAWVCGCLVAGIEVSNPAEVMDVCLVFICCVVLCR